MNRVRGRWMRLALLAVLVAAGALVIPGSTTGARAQANAPQGSPGLISLDVVDADLAQVVRILMSESKQNIVIGDPDVRQKKVTAMLNNVPLETALRYVVESVGGSYRREPDGVYIIGAKSAASTSSQALPPAGAPPLGESLSAQAQPVAVATRVRRDTRVEKLKLYNSSPTEMMWTMGIYRLEDAPKIERASVQPGVYVQKMDGSLEPAIMPPGQAVPLMESLKTNLSVAQRAPGVNMEAAQGVPPSPPRAYPTYPGQQRPGQPGQPGAPGAPNQGTSGLLPEGIDFVMTYDLDNSLIVRGDDEGIEELKAIISKLDVAPKQIMIEARFVSIATSELESLGINWSLERMNSTFSTQFSPAGNVLIGYANGDLIANLRAQLSKSHGKLINAPIITTMNNMPASIGFQTSVPFLSSTTIFNPSGGSSSASATYFLPITSQLYVLPRINNADNSVTIQIMPQLSDIEKFVDMGVNGSMPIVNSQYISTQRRVANGETIVLGGLIRKNQTTSVDKIPLIGDLPIIGPLFRSTKDNVDDKELLIFLTTTIIPERPVAGTGIGVVP